MFTSVVSVPHAINEILSSNNLYRQALLCGIANYTALAKKIKSDVEKLTASEVNIGTIVVAIKRLVDGLQEEEKIQNESELKHILPIIEGARMSLTGSVIDIDFNESRFDQLSDIFDELFEKQINHNYNVFQTDRQIRLLTEDIKEIRNIVVSKKFDGVIKGGLSKITITIPPIMNEVDNDNKYYSYQLVLDDEDALRAYELLKPTITRQSN
ncbi:MAG: hypothetical protein WA364_04020 [Candidatus Nitrosopolaris sp.]